MAKKVEKEVLKGELVVVAPKQGKIQLESTQVKFDAKISTKDLIDAVVFETEEVLLNKRKALLKEQQEANSKNNTLYKKVSDAINKVVGEYKNKDAEALAQKLAEFSGDKVTTSYSYYGVDRSGKLSLSVSIGDRYQEFSKKISVDKPAVVKTLEKEKAAQDKICNKIVCDLQKVQEDLNEIPRMKKKVQAGFVRNLVSGGLTPDEVLEKLREEMVKSVTSKK